MRTSDKDMTMRFRNMKSLWMLAFGTVCVQLIFIHMMTYMHFGLSDDTIIARMLMGYWGGIPTAFSPYVSAALSYPLCLLGTWIPGLPWFGLTQLLFLWVSCVVMCKAFLQASLKCMYPVWIGYGLYLLFSFAFLMERCATITYSNTAAVMAAAAIVQLFVSKDNNKGILVSMGLLLAAYALRSAAALPGMIVWGWLFILLAIQSRVYKKRSLRTYVRCFVIFAMGLIIIFSLDAVDQNSPKNKEYMRWQRARTKLVDYSDIYALSVEDFKAIGLSEKDLVLYEGNMLWESELSADGLERIHELYAQGGDGINIGALKNAALEAFRNANRRYYDFPNWWRIAGLLGLLSIALMFANRERRILIYIMPLGVIAMATAMFGYLAMVNRYPTQALVAILYPSISALICIAYFQLPRKFNYRLIAAIVIAVPCLFYTLKAAKTAYRFYTNPQPGYWQRVYENECAVYVNRYPELFFWIDGPVQYSHNTVYSDMTVTKNALPLLGWDVRSNEKLEVLKSIGVDPQSFSYDTLLRDDMRIISRDETPSEVLLNALTLSYGEAIDSELVDTYAGMNIFRVFLKTDK